MSCGGGRVVVACSLIVCPKIVCGWLHEATAHIILCGSLSGFGGFMLVTTSNNCN